MDDRQIFDALVGKIRLRIPGFEIRYKDKSWISKAIGILVWPFNREYVTRYTTTRYPHVYFPSRAYVRQNYRNAWKILAHEYVHLWDRQERGPSFNLAYALPQIIALLALVALLAIWSSNLWLLALLALVAGAPLPSPGRRDIEYRGYSMSMAVNFWRYRDVRGSTEMWILKQFTGSAYYFMWPFGGNMLDRLRKAQAAAFTKTIFDWPRSEPFKDVYNLLTAPGAEVA